MCWTLWCKWFTWTGSPTVAHKWGHRSGPSGQSSFLGLEAKYFHLSCLRTSFEYEIRIWLGPVPQQLQWDISAAQALHFGRVCMYADSKDLPDSHTESRIISCFNLVFLFLMAFILNHGFEAFHIGYLKSNWLLKCLDKPAALIKATKD